MTKAKQRRLSRDILDTFGEILVQLAKKQQRKRKKL
jgi:hypothetical protein